jgi:hypothetical protein
MTGGKIIAVSKAAEDVGKKALAEDEQHGVAQLNFDRGCSKVRTSADRFLRAVTE